MDLLLRRIAFMDRDPLDTGVPTSALLVPTLCLRTIHRRPLRRVDPTQTEPLLITAPMCSTQCQELVIQETTSM